MPLSLPPLRPKVKRLSAFQKAQNRLIELQQQLRQLEDERELLHHKEDLLWQSLDQQESIVYHLGVMLAEHMESDSAQAAALAALLNDVRAHQLKQTVGSGPCSGLAAKQLYTSKMLCAAVTPEQVAAIQQADVEKQLVPNLRDLTMRLAFLLSTSNQTLLSDSLSEKVDEYSGMVQLLHTAADGKLLALGLLNFDTLEHVAPPEGHWEQVCDAACLRPDQERTLATGFRWYAQRRSELIAELEQCAKQLQELLAPLHSQYTGDTDVSSLVDPLDMETAEKLQQVIENLDKLNRAIREADRYCVYLSINTMDKRQLAQIAVSSYPFLNQPPACCAVIAQRYEEKQKMRQRSSHASQKSGLTAAAADHAADAKLTDGLSDNGAAAAFAGGLVCSSPANDRHAQQQPQLNILPQGSKHPQPMQHSNTTETAVEVAGVVGCSLRATPASHDRSTDGCQPQDPTWPSEVCAPQDNEAGALPDTPDLHFARMF